MSHPLGLVGLRVNQKCYYTLVWVVISYILPFHFTFTVNRQ